MSKPIIAVVGSVNVDVVANAPRFPQPGETIQSTSFEIGFGGKGANQAVACARLCRGQDRKLRHNIETYMIGAIGDDQLCHGFEESLNYDGLNTSLLKKYSGEQTGVSIITVNSEGENTIVYSANANDSFPNDAKGSLVPENTSVAVFQLELRPEVVFEQLRLLQATGTQTILNPSPAVPLPEEVFPAINHLILNETETAILCDAAEKDVTNNLDRYIETFTEKGVHNVVITLGSNGAYWNSKERVAKGIKGQSFPSRKTKPVDTTAAGDTFLGAYAVVIAKALGKGRANVGAANGEIDDAAIAEAVRFGCMAASRTVEKNGAQKSIPWFDEVPGYESGQDLLVGT